MISRLLIANRGEIARRIARTASAMGIKTVAVYSEGDASSPHVREMDSALPLAGRSAPETYLNVEAVLAAAARSGADALHPGYGFLSERAGFARAVLDAGLIWVGPPPEAIEAMGDKLAAKQLMASIGVPVLPTWDPGDPEVRFPALVKAAAGGGGKGMRVVQRPAELAEAVAAARREAQAAFGDPTVFVEPYIAEARHVEVQVLADHHGSAVHCFERECSIQRRHQKVIEESPSPALDPATRERMCAAALAVVKAVGYQNAGTVEFVVDPDGGFWFLEMNTRLQVEHPVTELVTGLDLVREQLLVASGSRLSFDQEDLSFSGHAVEARLYAEDPAGGFLPSTGELVDWAPATDPPVRWDSGVEAGSLIGVEFDPMLAKVIAHAPTRQEAADRLALALERSRVRGIATNRDFLVAALRSQAFRDGDTTTSFVERAGLPLHKTVTGEQARLAALAATLSERANRLANRRVLASIPPGWRNTPMPTEVACFALEGTPLEVHYRAERDGTLEVDGSKLRAVSVSGGWVEFELYGAPDDPAAIQRHRFHVLRSGNRVWAQGEDGDVCLDIRDRFPGRPSEVPPAGGLAAPMPGKVVAVEVAVGDLVERGHLLVILEAMKMEHRVAAPAQGRVNEVRVRPGDQVEAGDLLVVIEEQQEEEQGEEGK